jgi:hypothetical protein
MIDKKELQTPRSARDYLPWVESKIEELGQTKAGKSAMHLGKGLVKELVEEALPLSIWMNFAHFVNMPITQLVASFRAISII